MSDGEWTAREQRKLTKRLHSAKLRYPASLEDIDFKQRLSFIIGRVRRGLSRDLERPEAHRLGEVISSARRSRESLQPEWSCDHHAEDFSSLTVDYLTALR
jgi:hypothetical protein